MALLGSFSKPMISPAARPSRQRGEPVYNPARKHLPQ
jgi:hypothetical protein